MKADLHGHLSRRVPRYPRDEAIAIANALRRQHADEPPHGKFWLDLIAQIVVEGRGKEPFDADYTTGL